MTTSTPQDIIDILKPGSPSPSSVLLKGPKAILEDIIGNNTDTRIKNIINSVINSLTNLLKGEGSGDTDNLIDNLINTIRVVLCDNNPDCQRSFDEVRGHIKRELESLNSGNDFIRKLEALNNIYNEYLKSIRTGRRANRSILLLFNMGTRYKDYVKALEKLDELRDDRKYLLTVLNVYYRLNKDYSVFDDIEWFLVLLSAWASRKSDSEKLYLPICPTKTHVVVASYYCIVEGCTEDNNSIGVDDFVELVKSILELTSGSASGSSGDSTASTSGSTGSTS